MNIGDHIRALHSNDEGFITKIVDDRTIEVEIEDGFTILLLKSDVVIVKKEESDFFDHKHLELPTPGIKKKRDKHIGIYIAFIPASENFVDPFIVNNTEYELLVTAHSITTNSVKGEFSNKIHPNSHAILSKWNIKIFEQWNDLHINVLYFKADSNILRQPLERKIKFQAKSFFNSFKQVPLIEQKGYLYQIDKHTEKITPTLSQSSSEEKYNIETPDDIIDLHESQLSNIEQIPTTEILNLQLETFQIKLDAAVATGMNEITFIHGNGNGVLKSKIQKELSEHAQVAFYQDAQKNKFGYGATYVKLK